MRLACLVLLVVGCGAPRARVAEQVPVVEVRPAIVRALPLLQRSQATWISARECASCHHQGLGMIALATVRQHGLPIDEPAFAAQIFAVQDDFDQVEEMVTGTGLINGQIGVPYRAAALFAADAPLGRWSDLAVHFVMGKQSDDGRFASESHRPPLEDSTMTATAWAVRLLRVAAPVGRREEAMSRVARATRWLATATPRDTEDRVAQLLGLVWGAGARDVIAAHASALLAEQRSDGGWAQLPTRTSDSFATGSALVALHLAGALAPSDAAFRRGLAHLVRTQQPDGSWHVPTRRKTPGLPHFETDFPYGEDQFISYAGSAWAVTALALADGPPQPVRALDTRPRDAPPRTHDLVDVVLFGTVDELRARLDGREPISNLAVLAAASRDADRLRLVLDRGGPADARSEGGVGLLAVAAHHSGGTASVQLLLERGAAVDALDKIGMTPLTRAVQAGDLATMRVLLGAGANVAHRDKTGGRPVGWAEAVGDLAKLEVLLEHGAKVSGPDFQGSTALGLAVIDRDVEFVRALLARGAQVDEPDQGGLTPLHWAAMVDAGHAGIANMLLAAGADRLAVSKAGDTPLALARRHGNRLVVRVLEDATTPARSAVRR